MRGAVRNKERWKGRRAPTQDPSTNHCVVGVGGGFGGQQMLFTKLALGALQSTLRHEDGHHNIFLTPYPYICIAVSSQRPIL